MNGPGPQPVTRPRARDPAFNKIGRNAGNIRPFLPLLFTDAEWMTSLRRCGRLSTSAPDDLQITPDPAPRQPQ